MKIKSYLDDYDVECQSHSPMKMLNDGRRVKEYVTTNHLDEGTFEEIHEVYEEVVPMRIAKRVTQKMMTLPVEERVECMDEAGVVQSTKVRALDVEALKLDKEPSTLEDLTQEVRSLRNAVSDMQHHRSLGQVTKSVTKGATDATRSFLTRAKARYNPKKLDETEPHHETSEEVVQEEVKTEVKVKNSSAGETALATLAWIVFGVVAGLFTYSMLG